MCGHNLHGTLKLSGMQNRRMAPPKLQRCPAGTEGRSEQQLQAFVTRDSMVGIAYCKSVEQVKPDGSFKSSAEPFKGLLISQ